MGLKQHFKSWSSGSLSLTKCRLSFFYAKSRGYADHDYAKSRGYADPNMPKVVVMLTECRGYADHDRIEHYFQSLYS